MIEEHLLDRTIVGAEDVADRASADEMADFFGDILGVIACAFEFLRHEEDVEAVELAIVCAGFEMTEHDEIAEAIHLSIGSKDVDGDVEIAGAEREFDVGDYLFETRRHGGEV